MAVASRRLLVLLMQVALGIKVLFSPAYAAPSTRVVYYLHTTTATWNEASAMCQSYGAVLLTMPEFEFTITSLSYVDQSAWTGAMNGLTQGFWAGLYRNSTNNLRWQKCTDHDSGVGLPAVLSSGDVVAAPSCYVSSSDLQTLTALNCDIKRPYICQRDDGQCWFQPFMDISIKDPSSNTIDNNDATTDEAECAKLCRSHVQQNEECWAFTFGEPAAVCRLHVTQERHKYAFSALDPNTASYFHNTEGTTAYVKICTGGWTTTLAASTSDNSPIAKDENCTVIAPDNWDDSVCYCECDQPPIILEAETLVMTIDEKVEQIVKELQVDPQNTSSTRRKKISVEDSRPSAQGIGYVGVGCLVVVFGSIFLMDLNVFFFHAAKLCNKGGDSGGSNSSSTSNSNGSNKNNKEQTDA